MREHSLINAALPSKQVIKDLMRVDIEAVTLNGIPSDESNSIDP